MSILSNSATFSAGRPVLPSQNFWPQWPVPTALIAWGLFGASLTFSVENITSNFSAHVCYGQVTGWIRITHGTEVGLGAGDIVLDGDVKGRSSPLLGPLLWPASPQAHILL